MAIDGAVSWPLVGVFEMSTWLVTVAGGRTASSVRGSSPSRASRRSVDFFRAGPGRDPGRGRTTRDLTSVASGRMATSLVRSPGRRPRAAGDGGRPGPSGRRDGEI